VLELARSSCWFSKASPRLLAAVVVGGLEAAHLRPLEAAEAVLGALKHNFPGWCHPRAALHLLRLPNHPHEQLLVQKLVHGFVAKVRLGKSLKLNIFLVECLIEFFLDSCFEEQPTIEVRGIFLDPSKLNACKYRTAINVRRCVGMINFQVVLLYKKQYKSILLSCNYKFSVNSETPLFLVIKFCNAVISSRIEIDS